MFGRLLSSRTVSSTSTKSSFSERSGGRAAGSARNSVIFCRSAGHLSAGERLLRVVERRNVVEHRILLPPIQIGRHRTRILQPWLRCVLHTWTSRFGSATAAAAESTLESDRMSWLSTDAERQRRDSDYSEARVADDEAERVATSWPTEDMAHLTERQEFGQAA
jgi:hypothetical protein